MTDTTTAVSPRAARPQAIQILGAVLLAGWSFGVAENTGIISYSSRPEEMPRPAGQWILGEATVEAFADGRYAEPLLNILMLVPLGIILSWCFGQRLRTVLLVGMLVSCGIEAYQWFFTNDRITSVDDVALNTIGALLGAVFVILLRRVLNRPQPSS